MSNRSATATPAQYRALESILTLTGHPIRHTMLIRAGIISDYDGTHTDRSAFAAVTTSNAALVLMVGAERYVTLAANIPPYCTDAAV
ncbi:MAG: hypothetical protein WCC45_04350 [Paeniglutamicibacter sp.]